MYHLEIKMKAMKEIRALGAKDQRRVLAALDVLAEDPHAGKKLEGRYEGAWSFRVWPYRIIYTIHRNILTVSVLRVGHRQGVYR
jgi:mRNA interferase RelE/StbE